MVGWLEGEYNLINLFINKTPSIIRQIYIYFYENKNNSIESIKY